MDVWVMTMFRDTGSEAEGDIQANVLGAFTSLGKAKDAAKTLITGSPLVWNEANAVETAYCNEDHRCGHFGEILSLEIRSYEVDKPIRPVYYEPKSVEELDHRYSFGRTTDD